MPFYLCFASFANDYYALTTHARRMTAGKDAKLRGVPCEMSSATHSWQADRKPKFQAVLAVS